MPIQGNPMKAPNVLVAVLVAAVASIAAWPTTEAFAQPKPALTRDVDGLVRGTLYSSIGVANFEGGDPIAEISVVLSIPAGKLLVVQQVDILTALSDGQVPIVQAITVNTGSGFKTIAFVPVGSSGVESGGRGWFTGVRPISIVLAPGHQITIHVQRSNNLGSASVNLSQAVVFGHLIDAP